MRSASGFTLIETVIALAVFLLCLALALPFLQMQRVLWERQESRREESGGLAATLNRLSRDLQEAGYHSARPPLRGLADDSISYVLSRDEGDPLRFSPANRRMITVSLKGADLMYRIQKWDEAAADWRRGITHKLASGLDGALFRGFDFMGEPVDRAEDVCVVEISLKGKRTGLRRSLVALRNSPGRKVP